MRRPLTRIAATVSVALMATVIGCLASDGSFVDANGKLLVATPEEVRKAQDALLSIESDKDMLPSMEGGVLFDCTVSQVEHQSDGSEMANLLIVNVISGPFHVGDQVRVQTPRAERGGVHFEQGKKFRVFAVELEGAYRTWASAGTVQIN